MMQNILFGLFIIAAIVGVFALGLQYTPQSKKPPQSLAKMAMDTSGFTNYEDSLSRRREQFSIELNKGIRRVHQDMDLVKQNYERFHDFVEDQQSALKMQGKNVQDILKNMYVAPPLDLMRTKDLINAFENQRQLLESSTRQIQQLNDNIKSNLGNIDEQLQAAKDPAAIDRLSGQLDALMEQQKNVASMADNYTNQALQWTRAGSTQLLEVSQHWTDQQQPLLKSTMDKLLAQQNDIQEKIRVNQENLELVQSQIKTRMEENQQKSRDLVEQNSLKMAETQERNEQQQQDIKDRTQDQMQRVQDQIQLMKDRMNR